MADQNVSQTSLLLQPVGPHQQQHEQQLQQKCSLEHLNYKSRLQEFSQRSSIPYPMYFTVKEAGPAHAPEYRSTVEIDGEKYSNLSTFSNRKAAEQDVSKLALEGISKKIKDCISKKTTQGGFPPIYEDKVFCKSILHEFATKMNIEKPKYDIVWLKGPVPVFVSFLVFNGVKYTGEPSVNKKEAEQLAARAAILSILADSGVGMHMSEIVKSKAKLLSAVHELTHANSDTGVSPLQPSSGTDLSISATEEDPEGTSQAVDGAENTVSLALPQKFCKAGSFEDQAVNVTGRQSHVLPRHEFTKPVLETSSQAIPLPIAFVPSFENKILLSASFCGGKRKGRKRKKGNKKAKTETETQVSELPLSQAMPDSCTVAQ